MSRSDEVAELEYQSLARLTNTTSRDYCGAGGYLCRLASQVARGLIATMRAIVLDTRVAGKGGTRAGKGKAQLAHRSWS